MKCLENLKWVKDYTIYREHFHTKMSDTNGFIAKEFDFEVLQIRTPINLSWTIVSIEQKTTQYEVTLGVWVRQRHSKKTTKYTD